MKLLFVDDDPLVIEGLENRLYRMKGTWDIHFANSPFEAVVALSNNEFDVVISDIRMTGVDGVELLEYIRCCYPGIFRIALTGQVDKEQSLSIFGVSHRVISKPAGQGEIESVIADVAAVKQLLNNPKAFKLVGQVKRLPLAPGLYRKLEMLIAEKSCSLSDLTTVIEQSPAVTARLLQLGNSAWYGLGRQVDNVEEAIAIIGLQALPAIVLSAELFDVWGSESGKYGKAVDQLLRHSVAMAQVAQRLMGSTQDTSLACTGAILHDVGLIVLAYEFPEMFGIACAYATEQGLALHKAEQQLFGFSHADVGAVLLLFWGFPAALIESVARHHHERAMHDDNLKLAAAINLAEHFLEGDNAVLNLPQKPCLDSGFPLHECLNAEDIAVSKQLAEELLHDVV